MPDAANDAEVQEAATFATGAISAQRNGPPLTLVAVERAATQVVAGLNYDLTLLTSSQATPSGPVQARKYHAVVYRPLGGGALQLTKFEEVQ